MKEFDGTTTATATRQPVFVLLEEDEGPSTDATTHPAPSPSESEAPPSAASAPQQAPASPTPEPLVITPDAYSPPDLGGVRPLSELAQAEADIETSKELAVDVEDKKAASISKVKLSVTAAAVVIAMLIGWSVFAPIQPPAPVAQPNQPGGTPTTTQPGAPGTTGAPTAPTVGIDIGNTQAIELETGDIDMIEQWAPVRPAEQSCTANALSQYLQDICKEAGQERYFQCAPDGFHWDYRIQGCEQI